MPTAIDLKGQKIGRLAVLSYAGRTDNGKYKLWLCRCDCGNEIVTRGNYLLREAIRSCGCLRSELAAERMVRISRRHGWFGTPEYDSWNKAKGRCKPDSKHFDAYAGRGILVCERFQEFVNFIEDLGPRPDPNMVLGRLDNDSGFTCGACDDCEAHGWESNCRWVTRKERQNNRTCTVRITANGVTRKLTEWAELTGLSAEAITGRINMGWTEEQAVSLPLGSRNPSKVFLPKDEVKRRYDARLAVAAAWRTGSLTKPDICPRCDHDGSVFRIEGHHYLGYEPEHWLDVEWMCRRCHCIEENKVARAPMTASA